MKATLFKVPGVFGQVGGRSTSDMVENILINLNKPSTNFKKRILELDIAKCFDKINYVKLINEIHLPIQMQRIIRYALKQRVLHERFKTQEGTPQGGIISPLLCNIALHGIETYRINQLNISANLERL